MKVQMTIGEVLRLARSAMDGGNGSAALKLIQEACDQMDAQQRGAQGNAKETPPPDV